MIDITRALKTKSPTWPGDTDFKLKDTANMRDGSPVNIMAIKTTTHVGTHLDAPYHYTNEGDKLGTVPLDLLIGDAQVLHTLAYDAVPAETISHFDKLPERILFFTGQPDVWPEFPEDFTALTAELIHTLAERGVKVVGIDSPSVDKFNSKDLPVHNACAETGIYIVEGLNLQGVDEGRYHLICLPLNLPDADASPVRAVLTRPER